MKALHLASFLARKISSREVKGQTATSTVIQISIVGIALGVMAMLLSVFIVFGFRNQITTKVTGFMSHMRISRFDTNNSFEAEPISIQQPFVKKIAADPAVANIQAFAYKACIIQANDEIQGIVLKGFRSTDDMNYFAGNLSSGRLPDFQNDSVNEVLLSASTAKELKLKAGDSFLVYFIQKDRKVRKITIAGIYNTGLSEEFDKLYLLCDLKLIQRVNNWQPDQVGGFEVRLHDYDKLDEAFARTYQQAGMSFNTQSIREIYPQLFNWLDLQNLNLVVILTLISLVAGITMISTLLILVLEKGQTIGILKSIGASDALISRTFMHIAWSVLLKGMLLGNLLGFGLAFLQSEFGLITLDEASYYLKFVPIEFNVAGILLINIITFVVCSLMLLIPSRLISRLSPVEVLRFN